MNLLPVYINSPIMTIFESHVYIMNHKVLLKIHKKVISYLTGNTESPFGGPSG
jgi:hypothetical protein